MPPPRKTTSSSKSRQSTLAFGTGVHKIAKTSHAALSGKQSLQEAVVQKKVAELERPRSPVKVIDTPAEKIKLEAKEEKEKEREKEREKEEEGEDEVGEAAKVPLITKRERPALGLGEDEQAARKVTNEQLERYYKEAILDTRKMAPVHQKGLTTYEKTLRHFDLSSQYGPCIGISRINRWKRAKALGMDPPIEVLALAIKMEDAQGGEENNRDARTAYIDNFLSAKTDSEA